MIDKIESLERLSLEDRIEEGYLLQMSRDQSIQVQQMKNMLLRNDPVDMIA